MHCAEPSTPGGVAVVRFRGMAGDAGVSGASITAGRSAVHGAVALLLALLEAGCSPPPAAAPPAAPSAASSAKPGAEAGPRGPAAGASAPTRGTNQAPVGATAQAPPRRAAKSRPDWDDYRRRAAEHIVAMNPERTYDGPVPEPLLAIPVLEIELNGDGSVRRIQVLRQPGQALDTVPLAIAAVRRASPFASVSHLPRPWVFTETFLFNEQRRFKPRSLDT